ncbi:MAG: protein BatD [Sphingobacteriales bacterium]|nr:MAG: protein BatD [Sphingobacteriales bacterium]
MIVAVRKFYLIWIWLLPLLVKADDVKISLSVSATRISMQDYLQVQYLIENTTRVSSFIPPKFKQFQIVEGPNQTTGYNMVNGNLKEYVSFSYLLRPGKAGKWVIPAATARVEGKNYTSNAVEVVVSKGAVAAPSEESMVAAEELILKPGEQAVNKIRNNLFVRLEVDRTSVMVGEPIVATYKLYTRLRSESRVTQRPSFNGFSVYDMANPDQMDATKEQFQGREYNVYLLRKVQLYPLQAGTFELESLEVTNDIRFIRASALDGGYAPSELLRELALGLNNSGAIVTESVALKNPPVSVVVKALPPAEDSSASAAVGHFTIRSFIDVPEVHKGDVVNLEVQVAGKGNFPMIPLPNINWPSGVDVFEANSTDQVNKFVAPLSGSKLFSIPFTVNREGPLDIPPVEFVYYDVDARKYVTAKSEPLLIQVLAARPSANKPTVLQEAKPANAWKYILTILALVLVGGGIYILLKRSGSPEKVVQPMQEPVVIKQEIERPKDPLEEIRTAFDRKDVRAFYRQLSLVIDQCMMNKYNVDGTGAWEDQLLAKGVEASMIMEIKQLKEDAELAMYTPFIQESKMVEDLARIERVVC